MACGGCRKNQNANQGSSGAGDLSRYAYLTPKQLRILEQQQADKKEKKE